MGFQIDWFSIALAFFIFLLIYNVTKITSAYLKWRSTKRQLKILDQKLKDIQQQIESNKAELSKTFLSNQKN